MKVLAQYLPQFHTCPQNNSWWGEGFTEWTLVKAAQPLWRFHQQPKIPTNRHYYDLSDISEMERQYKEAREYNIDGFNVYFYWSLGNRLLEKPLSNLLLNKDADFPYCLTWANHPWTRTWTNRKGAAEILFDQKYEKTSDEFNILARELSFYFQDERYIRLSGKSIFCIYKIADLPKNFVKNLRIELKRHGVEIYLVGMLKNFSDLRYADGFDAVVPFNPSFGLHATSNLRSAYDLKKHIRKFIISYFPKIADAVSDIFVFKKLKKIHYKDFCTRTIKTYEELIKSSNLKTYPMACCGFDNTPRYGHRATILVNNSELLFERQVRDLLNISKSNKCCELFFVNAWNEWGEGMYLESDEQSNVKKITALKQGLKLDANS